MLITAFPFLVDIAAVCDLLASEPETVTSDSDGGEEPMRSHGLPGIPHLLLDKKRLPQCPLERSKSILLFFSFHRFCSGMLVQHDT